MSLALCLWFVALAGHAHAEGELSPAQAIAHHCDFCLGRTAVAAPPPAEISVPAPMLIGLPLPSSAAPPVVASGAPSSYLSRAPPPA